VTDGEHNTPKRETQGKLLLSARNVKNGYIDLEAGVDYVGESEYQRLKKRCGPEKDDILITCSGTIGRTSRVPEKLEFVLVRSVALLKLKKDVVIPDFVEGYFQTQGMFEIMKRRANSSSQANLFTGQIKELQIFKVPIGLQQRFGEISRKLKVEKGVFEEALEKDQDLFNSLMQKAFKGELVLS
jgi:type I restriction enzyme S subunit